MLAKSTLACASPVAGFQTTPERPDAEGVRRPPIQWFTVLRPRSTNVPISAIAIRCLLRVTCRNPVCGSLREVCKRPDCQVEMLLARIFNLIVTDAAERLDEHHHGGDSGSGHLRSVMQRTG